MDQSSQVAVRPVQTVEGTWPEKAKPRGPAVRRGPDGTEPPPALAGPNRLTSPLSPDPADLYSAEPGEEEPAWVQTEREQFRDFRDLNKDGRLDGGEVGHWVLPPAQDQPLVEANHLLHESDTDKVRGGGPLCRSDQTSPPPPPPPRRPFPLPGAAWSPWGVEKEEQRGRGGGREEQRPRERGTET